MTSEQFHDALTLLPEDLVAHAEQYRCRKPKVIPLKPYAATAACLAVVLCAAALFRVTQQKSTETDMAVSFSAMQDAGAAAAEAPRMEAAKEVPESSRSAATADSALPFTCVETPYNPHNTACYAHGPSASVMVSCEELDAYLSKWDRLYLLDTLRDACEIYEEEWFASHDLLLIPADGVSAGQTCIVPEVSCLDGHCDVVITLSGQETDVLTNYHIAVPVDKGAVTDPRNITITYKSDTTN